MRKFIAGLAVSLALLGPMASDQIVNTRTAAAQTGACTYAWGYQVCAPAYITDAIYSAAAAYGVSGDWLFKVAACESGFNPGAEGPNGEIGLFQFEESTYYSFGGSGDIWNVANQANLAASMFASGLSGHWVTAGGC